MLKQITSSFIGLTIFATLMLIGINIVFSYPYFEHYNIHPAVLDLLNNNITPEELRKKNIHGFFLTWLEISHLRDVGELICYARMSLIVLVPLSLILTFWWKPLRVTNVIRAWFWTASVGVIIGIAHAIGGYRPISQALHPILFPQGNWMFDRASLIRRIYSTGVIEAGAVFAFSFVVVSLIILTILIIWKNHRDS
jgi:uncharacterized membrane protein